MFIEFGLPESYRDLRNLKRRVLKDPIDEINKLMCAEKTGGFNLVNYRHSSGVYHEQETEDLHRRI